MDEIKALLADKTPVMFYEMNPDYGALPLMFDGDKILYRTSIAETSTGTIVFIDYFNLNDAQIKIKQVQLELHQ